MGSWARTLSSLSEGIRRGLSRTGFDDVELMALAFTEGDTLAEFFEVEKELFPGEADEGRILQFLWSEARGRKRLTPLRLAAVSDAEIDVWAAKRLKKTQAEADSILASEGRFMPGPGKAPGSKWPTKLRRKLAAAGSAVVKDAAEREEVQRWGKEIYDFAVEAGLPIATSMSDPEQETLAIKIVTRGLRVGTLRARGRELRKIRSFLLRSFSTPWPRTMSDLMAYITARASEPCGPSVLANVQGAVYFLERGSGVHPDEMVSKDPLIEGAIAALSQDLAKGRITGRTAPRQPVIFMVYLEATIMDTTERLYVRGYAWWKAVQSWATLRFADQRGLDPASLRMSAGDLRGTLGQTKTTGADKQIKSRAFIVSQEAYVTEPAWLATGFEIWASYLTERREFLVLPSADLQGTLAHDVGYTDACGMTRALHAEFRALDRSGGPDTPLLLPEAVGFWTEHSPRHDVPSWVAALLTVPEEWLSLLGGWVVRGSAPRYIATAERRIALMQMQVAQQLRRARDGPDLVDENGLWVQLDQYLAERGVDEDSRRAQIQRLTWFQGRVGKKSADPLIALQVEEEKSFDDLGTIKVEGLNDVEARSTLPAELLGKFAISISLKAKFRRLHLLGGCGRVPGLHYKEFELHDVRPAPEMYHEVCKQCWRSAPEGLTEEGASDEDDSSSSTDADE